MSRADEMIQRDGYLQAAEREMRRAGLYDADSDYGPGAIAKCALELLDTWHRQGHSGGSAGMTLFVFNKLVNHEVLAPITNESGEWMDVSSYNGPGRPALWQNRRMPSAFSLDGGKTWYDVNEKRSWLRKKLGLGFRGFHIHVSKDLLA